MGAPSTTCDVTAISAGPPAQEQVTVHASTGLAAITNIKIVNGTVIVAPFTPGTTGPVLVTASKTNQSQPTTWQFVATDSLGTSYLCA